MLSLRHICLRLLTGASLLLLFTVPLRADDAIQYRGAWMVPVRAAVTALGGSLMQEGVTNYFNITLGAATLRFAMDNPSIVVNGTARTVSVPPTTIGNTGYISENLLRDVLGVTVSHEPEQVVMTYGNRTYRANLPAVARPARAPTPTNSTRSRSRTRTTSTSGTNDPFATGSFLVGGGLGYASFSNYHWLGIGHRYGGGALLLEGMYQIDLDKRFSVEAGAGFNLYFIDVATVPTFGLVGSGLYNITNNGPNDKTQVGLGISAGCWRLLGRKMFPSSGGASASSKGWFAQAQVGGVGWSYSGLLLGVEGGMIF